MRVLVLQIKIIKIAKLEIFIEGFFSVKNNYSIQEWKNSKLFFFFELKFCLTHFFQWLMFFVLKYLRCPIIKWDILRVCIDLIIYAIYIYIYIYI